jgi:hypothetical protein
MDVGRQRPEVLPEREPEREQADDEAAEQRRGARGPSRAWRRHRGGERDQRDDDEPAVELDERLHGGEHSGAGQRREPPARVRDVRRVQGGDAAAEDDPGDRDGRRLADRGAREAGDPDRDDQRERPTGGGDHRGGQRHLHREHVGDTERRRPHELQPRDGEEAERPVGEHNVRPEVEPTIGCQVQRRDPGAVRAAARLERLQREGDDADHRAEEPRGRHDPHDALRARRGVRGRAQPLPQRQVDSDRGHRARKREQRAEQRDARAHAGVALAHEPEDEDDGEQRRARPGGDADRPPRERARGHDEGPDQREREVGARILLPRVQGDVRLDGAVVAPLQEHRREDDDAAEDDRCPRRPGRRRRAHVCAPCVTILEQQTHQRTVGRRRRRVIAFALRATPRAGVRARAACRPARAAHDAG